MPQANAQNYFTPKQRPREFPNQKFVVSSQVESKTCHCTIMLNFLLLTLGAHAQRGLQYLVCHSVCLSVCLSVRHAILAVRATKSITKDTIVLSVRFAAILKRRFS